MNSDDLQRLAPLNRALVAAWGGAGNPGLEHAALRRYLETRTALSARYRMFEIANHRIFRVGGGLLVPYDAHGLLIVFHLEAERAEIVFEHKFAHGTVFTDRKIFDLTGRTGEAIDLERRIYHLDTSDMEAVQVNRLRDLAGILERINASGSRHEVVYLMRFLVARLCTTSYNRLAGAKNLQPEIMRVRAAMLVFLQGPFAVRLGLPTRVLVRHVSGLVTQPRLIERVWQDTIDLCEVHVRGSSITNEIRRSTHHALGWQTLQLAAAYRDWLKTGQAAFPDPEHMVPAPADEEARGNPEVLGLTERIAADLEQLLGDAQVTQRIQEWCDSYAEELQRCDSGRTLEQHLRALLEDGAEAGNRWAWQQHLRVIARMAGDERRPADLRQAFTAVLDAMHAAVPGTAEFAAERVRERIEAAADRFLLGLRARFQDRLFQRLDGLRAKVRAGAHLEVFEESSRIRHQLGDLAGAGAFDTHDLLLYQLDCLLEETGFYALRHVAHGYAEHGMDLAQCLRIVLRCADNLVLDGLYSREILDLARLLNDPACDRAARLDVLEALQRSYHRLVRRVSEAYEVMAEILGYDEEQMRGVLGNFFRGMHDLNQLAHFCDAARTHVASHGAEGAPPDAPAQPADPWSFPHLSHDDDIVRIVEDATAPSLRDTFGGKGSGLIYLSYLGIPTRDAFIIPTVVSRRGRHLDDAPRLEAAVERHVRVLEADIERDDGRPARLGDPGAPLLLAVRGGSVFSMPGQLETIVFVGMTWQVAEALAQEDEWFAWDACRRFLASYAASVWRIDLESLDLVDRAKETYGVELKIELPGHAMRAVVEQSRDALRDAGHGAEIERLLRDADYQLHTAIRAVCASWNGPRARRYREIKHLSERWNTAVIVQQMAAGNHSNPPGAAADETQISLTGVIPRTRMEPTGFRSYTGDIKFGASGDDLVGGLTEADSFEPVQHLHELAPMLERRINHINSRIRRFMGCDAEIEFTVEQGVLSVLQTRSAETEHMFEPRTFRDPGPACGRGIGVMGGAFRGVAAFSEADAARLRAALDPAADGVDGVLLVLENPVPDEIPLILSVDGLLASRGGSTAHAAVAVNGIDDKPFSAVLGVTQLQVLGDHAIIRRSDGAEECVIRVGDVVSIHGQTGDVYAGSRPVYG
ncbi:MAG: PEP/pyruvate-binding domain-containing protein [Xanthomonadales bacterium]